MAGGGLQVLASPTKLQLVLLHSQSQSPPSSNYHHLYLLPSSKKKKRTLLIKKCQAAAGDGDSSSSSSSSKSPPPLYQGIYGPWSVDSSDVREVILYRSGLVTAAASFVFASSTAFIPDHHYLHLIIQSYFDLLYALGAAGLGVSLFLIHIYVTEIKRTLQLLWLLGVFGSLATSFALAQPAGAHNLIQYVLDHPTAIWLVGPLFASFTGLVFKEGLCYGKLEAGLLTLLVPALLLGHLTGLMDNELKITLLGLWMALFVVFAGRKFTQPIKDDIGDKSVFIFNGLTEEKKKLVLEKLEPSNSFNNLDKRG